MLPDYEQQSPTTSGRLITSVANRVADKFDVYNQEKSFPDVVDWIEEKFWVPRPFDPITGAALKSGPLVLADHQKRILREAVRRDNNNKLKYSTVIYSAPKKSGKSTLAAAVGLYMTDNVPYAEIYCMANDGEQADERLTKPIMDCLKLHIQKGGYFSNKIVRKAQRRAELDNGSVVKAIPVDAAGEAGAEPTAVLFSELWGYDTSSKRRLYTEMTLPPTLYGLSIRWIETYAGYTGESELLWDLYVKGVQQGEPHPDFVDLVDHEGQPVVWVNEKARMFTYWDHIPRMIWQDTSLPENVEYYREQRETLEYDEYRRMHQNVWVSPAKGFIVPEWWDACYDPDLEPLLMGERTPAVVAIDAATINDCLALVLVTRDPKDPVHSVAVRAVRIFDPEVYGELDLEEYVGSVLREWLRKWNIVCVVYDRHQMDTLVKNLRAGRVTIKQDELSGMTEEQVEEYLAEESRLVQVWYEPFSQHDLRALADKRLRDMIQTRKIAWNDLDGYDIGPKEGVETLTKHIKQCGMKRQNSKIRIDKLTEGAHNDGAVALSMAVYQATELELSVEDTKVADLLIKVAKNEITYQEYQRIMSSRQVRIDAE